MPVSGWLLACVVHWSDGCRAKRDRRGASTPQKGSSKPWSEENGLFFGQAQRKYTSASRFDNLWSLLPLKLKQYGTPFDALPFTATGPRCWALLGEKNADCHSKAVWDWS
jgi:hypothetical protein